ncbi:hypothetical protein BC332_30849 [Capsicum chinense]|nr:hypothetical protein BC332_30849 [Capsicum chinense]
MPKVPRGGYLKKVLIIITAPRGVDPISNQVFDQGTGEYPLPLVGQLGRERGENRLPKKPAPQMVNEGYQRNLYLNQLRFYYRDRSANPDRARRRKGQTLRPNENEQRRNEKMRLFKVYWLSCLCGTSKAKPRLCTEKDRRLASLFSLAALLSIFCRLSTYSADLRGFLSQETGSKKKGRKENHRTNKRWRQGAKDIHDIRKDFCSFALLAERYTKKRDLSEIAGKSAPAH